MRVGCNPRRFSCAVALAGLVGLSRGAAAQSRPCIDRLHITDGAVHWPAPLDRTLEIEPARTTLRDALARVAAAAHVRISYSEELLDLDRGVCVAADHRALGAVLVSLLGANATVTPVAASPEQIVLAPVVQQADVAPSGMLRALGMLDGVVVTGNATTLPMRGSPIAVDAVAGRELAGTTDGSLATSLDGLAAGMWTWPQSPANMLNAFASIRGASSFGVSYPKMYVDGIEVANPLIVSQFSPDAIERVEVIRGPEGSAMYGTDATTGVINVITRHEGGGGDGNAMLHTSAGVTQGTSARGVLRQEHSLSLVSGTSTRSADLYVSGGTLGDFVPNGASRSLAVNGSARRLGDRTTVSATARYFMETAGSAREPMATAAMPVVSDMNTATIDRPQSVGEYTIGVSGAFEPSPRWTHSIVAGIDGYTLANVQPSALPIATAADSALRAAEGSAARATVRLSSALHTGGDGPLVSAFTFSFDQSSLHSLTTPPSSGFGQSTMDRIDEWSSTTGAGAQANVALDQTIYLTGALRLEHDSRLTSGGRLATLPMLGLSAVHDLGPVTVSIRGAYGRGVRAVDGAVYSAYSNTASRTSLSSIGAEEQAGTEEGLDVGIGGAVLLRVTHFDQLASGLLQQVAGAPDTTRLLRRAPMVFSNDGAISNRGWELEASAARARLTASGTLTLVDSRVAALASGYMGDLRVGDRMLGVPASTGSINLSWIGSRWSFSGGGAVALNWMNYDQLALARAAGTDAYAAPMPSGAELRQFWRRYDGGVRLRATIARAIGERLAFELTGDNLLNYQRGEPDDATLVPGQTIMTGLRMRF